MRSSHQHGIVLLLSRIFHQAQGFGQALPPNPGEQHLIGRGSFSGVAQNLARFLIPQHDRFARRTENNQASRGRAGVTLDIMLEFAQVKPSIGIKRSRNGGKYAFKQHVSILASNRKTGNRKHPRKLPRRSQGGLVSRKDAFRSFGYEVATSRNFRT